MYRFPTSEVIHHIHIKPKGTQLCIWIMGIILWSNIYYDSLPAITRMIINSPVTYWPIVKSFQGYQGRTYVSFKGTEPSLLTHSSHLLLNLRKWTIWPQKYLILFIFLNIRKLPDYLRLKKEKKIEYFT